MVPHHSVSRLIISCCILLIAISISYAQAPPCPDASSTPYEKQYHNVGDRLTVSINLNPCQTLEVSEHHDFNNNMNKGTVLRYRYLDTAGGLLYEEFQNATATGGKTFPKDDSRFEAFPWRGSVGPEGLPATLEIESIQVIEGDPEYSFVVTKKPRSQYNLGGRTFESAPVVETLPATYYGSLRLEEHGQYFKVHLDGNQPLYVSGYAEALYPLYSPTYHVAVYDSSQQKIQDLITLPVSGTVPYQSQLFTNPNATAGDFYINVTTTDWNVPDFKLAFSVIPLTPEEPLIFVPGIAGSYLVDQSQSPPVNLWPGFGQNHAALTLDPDNHPNDKIVATDAIRRYTVIGISYPGGTRSYDEVVYGPLLEKLAATRGYREYQVNDDRSRRTTSGCDIAQRPAEPNLFVFAYDWRQSDKDNASLLEDYVGCVQRFHPGVKINILAHSQGGLIARRYILDNANK